MPDWKGFGRCLIWVIYAETLLRREQSQEALRHVISTEIIHVLITLPVCLRMSSAEPLVSPATRLCDPISVRHSMKP